ncbi:hypothetical protein APHAL10511_004679 [Amanita phalloides]|nr:hypothetical protein APHAL10511_004679 [Amanita phalloides]
MTRWSLGVGLEVVEGAALRVDVAIAGPGGDRDELEVFGWLTSWASPSSMLTSIEQLIQGKPMTRDRRGCTAVLLPTTATVCGQYKSFDKLGMSFAPSPLLAYAVIEQGKLP